MPISICSSFWRFLTRAAFDVQSILSNDISYFASLCPGPSVHMCAVWIFLEHQFSIWFARVSWLSSLMFRYFSFASLILFLLIFVHLLCCFFPSSSVFIWAFLFALFTGVPRCFSRCCLLLKCFCTNCYPFYSQFSLMLELDSFFALRFCVCVFSRGKNQSDRNKEKN